MIVVDASALVAIALREPDRLQYQRVLEDAEAAYLSPINYVETGIVLAQRNVLVSEAALHAWLAAYGVEVRDDVRLGPQALEAYRQYGKGIHSARLDLGDCFAYALAKALDAPLLYKGDDFARTDIRSAL